MAETTTVTVELGKEDAALFLKFREYQTVFEILVKAGVFNIQNGNATLHFDPTGTLADVECHLKLYRRGVKVIPILVQ